MRDFNLYIVAKIGDLRYYLNFYYRFYAETRKILIRRIVIFIGKDIIHFAQCNYDARDNEGHLDK